MCLFAEKIKMKIQQTKKTFLATRRAPVNINRTSLRTHARQLNIYKKSKIFFFCENSKKTHEHQRGPTETADNITKICEESQWKSAVAHFRSQTLLKSGFLGAIHLALYYLCYGCGLAGKRRFPANSCGISCRTCCLICGSLAGYMPR